MWGNSNWIGERRICWIRVTGLKNVRGFGRLPKGRMSELWLFGGGDIHGARARLFRDGVLIAEDLHVGAVITRLGKVKWLGILPVCVVATGYGDVRKGDRIEVYTRAEAADGDPGLVPGYQDLLDRREERGRAEVDEVDSGPLSSRVARVTPTGGRLAVGDRVRVLRGGRPVAEALRLLSMTDPGGRPIGEASAGGGASLYLGFHGLRPGDTVVAFDVPPPAWTEARAGLLDVREVMRSDSAVAQAVATPVLMAPGEGREPVVGFRARVLRDRVVIADGLTIGYFPDMKAVPPASRRFVQTAGKSSVAVAAFHIGLDFPDLRLRDEIEAYEVVPAGTSPKPRS
jgi:hypothetical protein